MKLSKNKQTIILVIIIIVIIVFKVSSFYNSMVKKQEAVSSQWAQVENVYKRRADLIPNLVATVKGYAKHESQTLVEITQARNNATRITLSAKELTSENLQKYAMLQGQISSALSRLIMVKEAYPDLKANQNFIALQDELSGTENRISTERNRFNETVKDYNAYIKSFPHNIISNIFNFQDKAYFKAEESAKEAPKVQF